ncbi:MAG: hypothetical protein GX275_06605 [Clostridiales bacterium]|nr:hypothetical protein [Clostridiales bacterium]
MKEVNNYIKIGVVFNTIFLISNVFDILPEFLKGLSAGLGITLIFIGSKFGDKLSSFREKKLNLIKKLFIFK